MVNEDVTTLPKRTDPSPEPLTAGDSALAVDVPL
jgi:hypothetical protein